MSRSNVFAAIVAIVLLVGIAVPAQDGPARAAPKWTYKLVTVPGVVLPGEEADLNRLADGGWELVSTCVRTVNGVPGAAYVFKRPKN